MSSVRKAGANSRASKRSRQSKLDKSLNGSIALHQTSTRLKDINNKGNELIKALDKDKANLDPETKEKFDEWKESQSSLQESCAAIDQAQKDTAQIADSKYASSRIKQWEHRKRPPTTLSTTKSLNKDTAKSNGTNSTTGKRTNDASAGLCRRGYFEHLVHKVFFGFNRGSHFAIESILSESLFNWSNEFVSQMNNCPKLQNHTDQDRKLTAVSYLLELVGDLCIGIEANVSESPGFEAMGLSPNNLK